MKYKYVKDSISMTNDNMLMTWNQQNEIIAKITTLNIYDRTYNFICIFLTHTPNNMILYATENVRLFFDI